MFGTLVFLTLVFFSVVSCAPKDLSCDGVWKLDMFPLKDCQFVNATDIECVIYSIAYENVTWHTYTFVIKFATVFYLKEKFNPSDYVAEDEDSIDSSVWCLGVRSSNVSRADWVPDNASNIMDLPTATATLLTAIQEGSLYVQYFGSAAAGFATIRNNCDLNNKSLSNSCILKLQGASYVVAPGNEDISIWDILFGNVLQLYFDRMGGVLRHMQIKATFSGPLASYWMTYLPQTHIQILNISNNNYNKIFPATFRGLNNLTELYMQNCQLEGIREDNFQEIPNLEVLDISRNYLDSFPTGVSHLKKLRVFNVEGIKNGPVTVFEIDNDFVHCTSLKELRLSDQPLEKIERAMFPVSLEILELSNCGLSSLPDDAFHDLTNLKLLVLSYNKLKSIESRAFYNIVDGADIILRGNNIFQGQKFILNSINRLDLASNAMRFPDDVIESGKVSHLDLTGNKIVNWTSGTVFKGPNYFVSNVNISYNRIPVIDYQMVESLNTIESIDLGGNQFDCQDCSLPEFQHWLNTTSTNILLYNHSDIIRCSLPVRQKGEPLLYAEYNVTACEIVPMNLLLVAGVPAGVTLALIFMFGVTSYAYRYEIIYIKHLINVRRKNRNGAQRAGCKYDVFVSYSSKDRDWIMNVLKPGLDNPTDRYAMCLHDSQFAPGKLIVENIVNCIDISRRVLLVLSNNYIASEWCKWELRMAQHRIFEQLQDVLILIELERLDRSALPTHLRLLMDTRTYLEWPGVMSVSTLKNFWSRLKEALGTALVLIQDADEVEPDCSTDEQDESEDSDSPLTQPFDINRELSETTRNRL